MFRNITLTAILILCFVLQSTVFSWFEFGGISPNILIIFVASIGFMRGPKSGIVFGFLTGLLFDLFFGTIIGFFALLYMYIGCMNGFFQKIFYPKDIKLPLILLVTSSFIYSIACYVLLFLLRGRFHFTHYLSNIIIPEIVYTLVVTLFLYPILLIIDYKFNEFEKRSERKFV